MVRFPARNIGEVGYPPLVRGLGIELPIQTILRRNFLQELSLRAAERVEQDREQLHAHWKQRLERANYEASRARRQYDVAEPENRLVVRALEHQWEEKLADVQRLEEDYSRFQSEQPRHLTPSDRDRIRALACDLPALWRAETTTGADRRAVVRLLIERVELTRQGDTERVAVVVYWRGGRITRQEITQGLRQYTALDRYDDLRKRVIGLRGQGRTADQIATVLNGEGYSVPRGERYTEHRVRQFFARFGQSAVRPASVQRQTCPVPTNGGCPRWRRN